MVGYTFGLNGDARHEMQTIEKTLKLLNLACTHRSTIFRKMITKWGGSFGY
jgi:hypothetical protein